jgi:hypothetical protein
MSSLKGNDKKRYLLERLGELRHLLRKSVADLCAGDLAEALRIATTIRVMVHETGSSKPLLKQIVPNYLDLKIQDWPDAKPEPGPPGTHAVIALHVPVSMNITEHGVFLNPDLNGFPTSIVGRWWARPSLILPNMGSMSRKEVVLGLANNEGGAHVDTEITRKYEQLLAYGGLRMGTAQEITTLNVSRLMAGQAGVELLDCLDRNFPE